MDEISDVQALRDCVASGLDLADKIEDHLVAAMLSEVLALINKRIV